MPVNAFLPYQAKRKLNKEVGYPCHWHREDLAKIGYYNY